MIFKQYYLGCLAHASYLIADEESRMAAVVDPQRDVEQYLADAAEHGLQIRHVFLTHLHADFVAGHLELRDRAGAAVHLGAKAETEYAFTPMHDGDELTLGPSAKLTTLETPGHTPESISILVFDADATVPPWFDAAGTAPEQDAPWGVLTGDTLFVGDVGRPDLRVALGWKAEDLGRMLYDSLHRKLLTLPDSTRVYPAHGAGSLCGKALGKENSSTIGVQRRLNYALQPMSADQFVGLVLADQPDAPAYFTYDAVLNTRERPTLDRTLENSLRPLTLDALLGLAREGAQLLDVRDPAYFAAGHRAGSINIGLGGQYATWSGTVLDRERPIIIIAEPGREYEAAMRLGRIGFDRVAGYLEGGMQSLAAAGKDAPALSETAADSGAAKMSILLAVTERVSPEALEEELRQDAASRPVIVDVRAPREWSTGHMEGSVNLPLNHLAERLEELPRTRRIVVHCASGYRSSIAASILERYGFAEIADLTGGFNAWKAAQPAGAVRATEC
jgi:hydroxyacylglutathione hydrolase